MFENIISMRKMILLCALFFAITETKADTVRPKYGNVNYEAIRNIVPFGQITKEGFWDPKGYMKQPIDIIELHMPKPSKKEHIYEENKDGNPFWLNKPTVFLSPRDAYMAEHEIGRKGDEVVHNITRPLWLDLTGMLQRNALSPTTRKRIFPKSRTDTQVNESKLIQSPKIQHFTIDSFDIKNWRQQKQKVNWTTCSEFAKGALFHPKDILDIDWVPFYIWSNRRKTFCDVHRFSYPTVKLVKHFRDTYGPRLTKKVDWNQPTLYMNGTGEWLLVAADRTGLFHAIPRHSVSDYSKRYPVSFPVATMRFKVIDPYLAYMICDESYASVMAVAGTEPPSDKDKELEASGIGFRGVGAPITRNLELEIKMQKAMAEEAAERERRKFIEISYK